MYLDQELAQKFVDSIIANLGYNVNIMNSDGIIIASGDKERIGTFHKVATEVIRTGQRLDIGRQDGKSLAGVKEGINMPFYYNKALAGVIGITGDPNEMENAAQMVKMVVELMLEQEYLKEQMHSHQSQKTFFINRLLSLKPNEDLLPLQQWGYKLGYDLNLPRIAILFTMKPLFSNHRKHAGVTKESIRDTLLKTIKDSPFHQKQDISGFIDTDQILVFKTVRDTSADTTKRELDTYMKSIYDNVKSIYGQALLAGIGSCHPGLHRLKDSFMEAQGMLKFADCMNVKEGALFVGEHFFEYLYSKIPEDYLEHFFKGYAEKVGDRKELVDTIRSLVKNNMNVVQTASELFLHRNTVMFRLGKIKDLLGIDPINNDEHRILLRLLLLYLRYPR